MNDVLNFGKKLFTFSVVAVTIVWSMGLAALVPAAAQAAEECPALESGDLVKMPNESAVFLVGSNMTRYFFPNMSVYYSWFADFKGVKESPKSCVGAMDDGGQVFFRPGSKLVKNVLFADVYAILPNGQKAHIANPSVASNLYGDNWEDKIVDFADVFLSGYKKVAELSSAVPHDGMLVKTAASTSAAGDVYYVSGGKLHMVSGTLSSVTSKSVVTVAQIVFDSLEVASGTTTEAEILSAVVPMKSDTTPEEMGGDVTVSLAANTPAATDVLTDSTANEYPQGHIAFTTVNVKGGSADAKVKTLKFTRTGISNDSDLGNLYLYDGETKLAEYTSFNDKVVTFSKSSGLFTVKAGQTKSITLRGDIARGSTSVGSGKKIGFKVASSSDVVLDGGSVMGSFPLTGNEMATVSVSDLGHMYVTGTSTYPSSVKADEANKELWRLTLNADAQDMEFRSVNFTMVGTIATDDIANLRLEVGGVQYGSSASIADDNTVRFDLSASPLKIDAGQSKTLVLRGDMMGGSGRVFKFTVQRVTDMWSWDTEYGVYVPVAVGSTTGAFTVLEPTTGTGTSVSSGTVTVGVATDSPTGNIPDGGTNVNFAKFSLEATGENVKIDNLSITCSASDTSVTLKNVKLLYNGSQVGTTDTSLLCNNSETAAYTFGNTLVVPTGSVSALSVVADTTDSTVSSTPTISVSLAAGSSNAQGQTTLTALSTSAQTARTLTVRSGVVSVAENSAFGDKTSSNPTGTVNANAIRIASFVITAGSAEAADVTQITLQDNATTAMASNFQNLKLMHDNVQIGTTINSLNTTVSTYSFTPANSIRIAAGQQYVVDVYADVKSSAADAGVAAFAPIRLAANAISATGVLTNASANSSNSAADLQNAYISASGNLTVTVDGDTANANTLVLGASQVALGTFKLEADAAEAIRVTDLVVSVSTTAATQGTLKNLTLYIDGEAFGPSVNLPTGSASTGTFWNATFSGLDLEVPRSSSKLITVKADLTTYDNGGASDGEFYAAMVYDIGSADEPVTAVGSSSGASITGSSLDMGSSTDADQVANAMSTYRTKLNVAFASDTPTGASVGQTGATVAKFVVSNTANVGNYSGTLKAFDLNIGNTGVSSTQDRTLKIYKNSISTSNQLFTTTWSTGSANGGDTGMSESDFTDVSISAGGSVTLIVTLDSNDAATDDKLSFSVGSDDVIWSDGVTSSISSDLPELPLTAKTLTF